MDSFPIHTLQIYLKLKQFSALGTTAKVTHVYIDPCNTDTCILRKGGNSTISVSFVPNGVTKSVKAIVHGVIAGIPVPFPITGDDGCQSSGLTCPLKAGIEVKYAKTIPVLKEYPSVSVDLKVTNDDEEYFLTFYLPYVYISYLLYIVTPS